MVDAVKKILSYVDCLDYKKFMLKVIKLKFKPLKGQNDRIQKENPGVGAS